MTPQVWEKNGLRYEIYPDGRVYSWNKPYRCVDRKRRYLKGMTTRHGQIVYQIGGTRENGGIRVTERRLLDHFFPQTKQGESHGSQETRILIAGNRLGKTQASKMADPRNDLVRESSAGDHEQ